MDDNRDISIIMAEDAINYIAEKYPNLTCGDYLSFQSVMCHMVAKWIAKSMNVDINEVINVILAQCIQFAMLEDGEKND